jgi:hypothetical protein
MHFEVAHEFDIPLDALELAVLSPTLVESLAPRLQSVEWVRQKEHRFDGSRLERVWAYQANVKLPSFARPYVTKEMCAWEERTIYRLGEHASSWTIYPQVRPEWAKYFTAGGRYRLVSLPGGRTRRIVEGELALHVPPGIRHLGERLILGEMKKTLEAEAATLRDLATLA